jgi:hypothetical protein
VTAGIRFEVVPPDPPEVLPRMDVAAFAGFAAAGPIGVPVAIEDPARFGEVFGADVGLAWDPVRGEPVQALLGPAVRAFFANGGRRCWVLRVAGDAERTRFEVPGVVAIDAGGRPGFADMRARAAGSWADGVTVSSTLESTVLAIDAFQTNPLAFRAAPGSLAPGDVVRLRFGDATLYAAAATTAPAVVLGPRIWVRAAQPTGTLTLRYLGRAGTELTASATVVPASLPDGLTRLALAQPLRDAPSPGALVRAGELLLDVVGTDASREGIVALTCTALRIGTAAATSAPDGFAERLTLRLDAGGTSLGGIGLAPAHPLFMGALPTDEARFAGAAPAGTPFALAGPAAAPAWYAPVSASFLPSPALAALHTPAPALERDGLDDPGAGLFLDPALAGEPVSTLLATAAYIRDQSPQPRALTGVHAFLGVDEVTLLALPDAAQRRWTRASVPPAAPPDPPAPGPVLDRSRFLECAARVPDAPVLTALDTGGAIRLTWTATGAPYELQRAGAPDWSDAETLYRGPDTELDLSRPPAGAHAYLRVRADGSAWSEGVLVEPVARERWLLDAPARFSPDAILAIQRGALRMCAARGDLLALLALPEHYESADAAAHVRALRAERDPVASFGALYHPWLLGATPDAPTALLRTPPDGAAAGIAAARPAWLAPANIAIRGVVALGQPATADGLNAVVRDPNGIVALQAGTLSTDPYLRAIGVRRLLALLRRLALRHGDVQAFERNDDVTRRTIRRSFETLLGFLFAEGAFAGRSAREGFAVTTPVTPADLDQGRLVVELRVAPSLPLEFLTIRLVREGAGTLQVQVG